MNVSPEPVSVPGQESLVHELSRIHDNETRMNMRLKCQSVEWIGVERRVGLKRGARWVYCVMTSEIQVLHLVLDWKQGVSAFAILIVQ